jgi:hypothetical protein
LIWGGLVGGGGGGKGRKVLIALAVLFLPAFSAPPAFPAGVAAQDSFAQATRDLTSADAGARLRAVQLLKDAAYPEAAVPLAPLVNDPEDAVQAEAIAAELNIFLAEKVTTRRRIGRGRSGVFGRPAGSQRPADSNRSAYGSPHRNA